MKKINLSIGFEEGPIPIEYWSNMSPLYQKKDQYRYWSRLVQIGPTILVQIGHVDDNSSFVCSYNIYIYIYKFFLCAEAAKHCFFIELV